MLLKSVVGLVCIAVLDSIVVLDSVAVVGTSVILDDVPDERLVVRACVDAVDGNTPPVEGATLTTSVETNPVVFNVAGNGVTVIVVAAVVADVIEVVVAVVVEVVVEVEVEAVVDDMSIVASAVVTFSLVAVEALNVEA